MAEPKPPQDAPPSVQSASGESKNAGRRSRSTIQRRALRGEFARLARGAYVRPEAEWSLHRDLLKVALHSPNTPFCLLTALQLHGLRQQAASVWVAVGNKSRVPFVEGVPIQVARQSGTSLKSGLQGIELDGVAVQVTSVAKTIVDCFKYRSLVGLDVATAALRLARSRRMVTIAEIDALAQSERMSVVMRPYLLATG